MAKSIDNLHYLKNKWTLWSHLPNETDWSLNSYKNITNFNTVESILTLYENLPENIIKYCMLFIMKEGITPVWEDEHNRNGGCFSYKINNKFVAQIWKDLSYSLMGETLTENDSFNNNINGITISPKKNFCIIKIWISNCDNTDPNIIKNIDGLFPNECFFKKHI
jgi:translation initiation factor 4E